VLATAVVTVAAASLHVVVADLVKFLAGCINVALAVALLLAGSWDLVTILVEAVVFLAVLEATAITELALTLLLEVDAKSTWWVGDGLTLGVVVLALVAVAAAASVAEGAADFFGVRHVY
jgi:hypothetical protein